MLSVTNPVRTGRTAGQRVIVMELAFLLFLVLITLASFAGLTVDSRDGADWKPTVDGMRVPR
jgi:hypothetical protein